jgi:hypothetical protein
VKLHGHGVVKLWLSLLVEKRGRALGVEFTKNAKPTDSGGGEDQKESGGLRSARLMLGARECWFFTEFHG